MLGEGEIVRRRHSLPKKPTSREKSPDPHVKGESSYGDEGRRLMKSSQHRQNGKRDYATAHESRGHGRVTFDGELRGEGPVRAGEDIYSSKQVIGSSGGEIV